MALTPEQIAQMDQIAMGGQQQSSLTPEMIAQMDQAAGLAPSPEIEPQQGDDAGALSAGVYGLNSAVPFGNRISSGIGAGIARGAGVLGLTDDDRELGELYSQAMQDTEQTMQENPGAALGGTLAGIGTTLPLAATKGPQAVGRFIRGGQVAKGAGAGQKALNLGGQAVRGGAVGAGSAALYGAGEAPEGEILQGAQEAAPYGAAFGGAMPVAGAALKRAGQAITPAVDDAARELGRKAQKFKIPISADQITDSRAVKLGQKISQDLPFSGQDRFRDKQMLGFNRALFKTVGEDSDKFSRGAMDKAFKNVGKKFDKFGKGKVFGVEPLNEGIEEILQDAGSTASQDAIANFKNAVSRISKEVRSDGTISGEKLNMLRSQINRLGRKAGNFDTKGLLADLENAIIETMGRGSPDAGRAFSEAKRQYKNLLALEPLAAKAKGGNISPSQLRNRVSKIYGRSFVRGKAGDIGELADIGAELLPELGGSDTQARQMIEKIVGVAGTAGSAGTVGIPATAAGLTGNRAIQELVNRNPAVVRQMIKEAKDLPPEEARKVFDYLSTLGIGKLSAEVSE